MKAHGVLNLTPRQELYLRAVCRGDSRQEVADEAYVSYETVRNTLGMVYRALGTPNAAAACYLLGVADQRAVGLVRLKKTA